MNNFSLTRLTQAIATACISLAIVLTIPTNVFAYNPDTQDLSEDGVFTVTNDIAGEYDAMVTLYMWVQPNSDYESARYYYGFNGFDGEYDYGGGYVETSGELRYWFYPQNKKVFSRINDGTSDGEVWMWNFGVQNGKYYFSEPDGVNHFFVLTSSQGSPFSKDGYTDADVTVIDGEDIRLYALYGDYDWASANVDTMIEWAKNQEVIKNKGRVSLEEDTNTIEITTGNVEEPDKEEVVVEDQQEEGSSFDTVDNSDKTSMQEISVEESEKIAKENKNAKFKDSLFSFLKTAPFVIVLIVFLFWIKKKDEEKNE